jgi:hydrogenase maturation protease
VTERRVVIGIGNAYRGDDAAGLAVAERCRTRLPAEVRVIEAEQEPTRLIDAWESADAVFVVDAVVSGSRAGTVHRYDATDEPLPAGVFRSSTHAFGVGDAVELARALGRLPRRVVVYGVEGAGFESGAPLSPAVAAAVDDVVSRLEEELCTNGR